MLELPRAPLAPTQTEARRVVIIAAPKVGKTVALAQLPNSLLIDADAGSEYIPAPRAIVKTWADFMKIVEALRAATKKAGAPTYDFISIDTLTSFEPLCVEGATLLYKSTTLGKSFTGDSVLQLPNGAGYYWLWRQTQDVMDTLQEFCKVLILTGHVREKALEGVSKDVMTEDIDLTGKNASVVTSSADAVAKLSRVRKPGGALNGPIVENLEINFAGRERVVCGSRPTHLKGKKFILVEGKEDETTLVANWKQIFPTMIP